MGNRVAHEVANAARAIENDLPSRFVSTKSTDVLVQIAKKIQRMQTKYNARARALKALAREIRAEKKNLRALARSIGKDE